MRKISKEELSEILNTHKIWLYSSHKLGSRADLSGADLSGADLYRANLSGADLSRANLEEANLEEANLEEANLSRANLHYAKLHYANLSGADLSGADLSGANLYYANLSGANLSKANLFRTNLFRAKGVTIFQYEQHPAAAFNNNRYITIGCKTYRTINWVKNFEKIGKDEDYSNSQIKMYGQFINMINETLKEKIL